MPREDWNSLESITQQHLRLSAEFFMLRIKHEYSDIDFVKVAEEISAYLTESTVGNKQVAIRAMNPVIGCIGTNRKMILRDALLCWAAATDPKFLPIDSREMQREISKRKLSWLSVLIYSQRDGNYFTTKDIDSDGESIFEESDFDTGDDGIDVDNTSCVEGIKSRFNAFFAGFHPLAEINPELDTYNLLKGLIISKMLVRHSYGTVLDYNTSKSSFLNSSDINEIRNEFKQIFTIYGEIILSDQELETMEYTLAHIDEIPFSKNGAPYTNSDLDQLVNTSREQFEKYRDENATYAKSTSFSVFDLEIIKSVFDLPLDSSVRKAHILTDEVQVVEDAFNAHDSAEALFYGFRAELPRQPTPQANTESNSSAENPTRSALRMSSV